MKIVEKAKEFKRLSEIWKGVPVLVESIVEPGNFLFLFQRDRVGYKGIYMYDTGLLPSVIILSDRIGRYRTVDACEVGNE